MDISESKKSGEQPVFGAVASIESHPRFRPAAARFCYGHPGPVCATAGYSKHFVKDQPAKNENDFKLYHALIVEMIRVLDNCLQRRGQPMTLSAAHDAYVLLEQARQVV